MMNLNNVPAYELIQKETLEGLKSEGYLLRHKKSGARVVLVKNDDDNKVFTIGFRTPPKDSTGVPHIIEHTVLCGSREFPVKDPFVELVKGSLNTFLNAITYPDKTVYPVASCNEKDFKNLMHVYMDAVFYPAIYEHEEIFRQEGWSYQLEAADDKLTYNGVVYNEMKGAFSSPEDVLYRVVMNTLFPDTTYANESGGDPEYIPDLTYEQFLNFHRKFYHPSNSYIYLYGDMDMEERLNWMDAHYLSAFTVQEVDSQISFQKPFTQMTEKVTSYSITNAESEEDNTYLSYNKVIGDSLDRELYQAFQILDYALLSAPGAPLKKALVDAGIGKDIMGSYENGTLQPMMSIIAKNANACQKDEFVKVIEDTLKSIVANGLSKKALEAGINYHEFRYREADFGSFPKGLMCGLQIFDSWLYDDTKPFIHVEALDTFETLKAKADTGYFEELIQKYLLDNQHGAIVIVKPEKGLTAKTEAALEEKLQAYKDSLTAEEVEELVQKTKALTAYQEEPSEKEDLEKIPVLQREDISREIAPIYNEEIKAGNTTVVFHDIETNGIGYVNLIFDMSGIEEELLPYTGILQSVLGVIDTENYEYGELFNEINAQTGGIGTSLELYTDVTKVKEKEFRPTFEMRAKALYHQLPIAFCMMEEILLRSKLDDEKRLKEIVAQTKSRLQMRIQSSGHISAAMRAMAYHSPTARMKDMTAGIEYYELICDLAAHFDEKKEMLIKTLKHLAEEIFSPSRLIVSYTAAKEGLSQACDLVKALEEKLTEYGKEKHQVEIACEKKNEGFKTASKVQYVATAGNFIDAGYEYTGALQILKVILSYEYLWQNIRVKGGAYGCMSSFNRLGDSYLVSFRDPHLKNTLEVYEGVAEYLRRFDIDERDMTKYIIGTISNIDQPMTPAIKGSRSMNLYLNHVTAEMIQKERQQILEATQEDIRKLADIVEAVVSQKNICVIGGEEKIADAQDLFMETKELN